MVAAALILTLGGIAACGVAASQQQAPPTPRITQSSPSEPSTSSQNGSVADPMPRSIPTSITVPKLDVAHSLVQLGLNPDGTMEVPPLSQVDVPGWYKHSPTPGEVGPAVIVGHIDSAEKGPGVFYKLGAMHTGDTIRVHRSDGTTATFTVYQVEQYPKSDFPTQQVYGDTDRAELRLISCGGSYNAETNNYTDDIVVYARLTTTT